MFKQKIHKLENYHLSVENYHKFPSSTKEEEQVREYQEIVSILLDQYFHYIVMPRLQEILSLPLFQTVSKP